MSVPWQAVDRRELLALLSGLVVLAFDPRASAANQQLRQTAQRPGPDRAQLEALCRQPSWSPARVAGRLFLAGRERPATPGELASELFEGLAPGEDLEAFVIERVRGDFDAGRTVRLANWSVALSEARFYGLVSLLAG